MVAFRRIHKKSSPNAKITLFVVKREVIDYLSQTDPIEGVVVFHDEYIQKNIIGQLNVTFRYGREDDEVMGLNFNKELLLVSEVIHPSTDEQSYWSKLQMKLVEKYGKNARPFRFKIAGNAPQSVILNSFGSGKQCGIYYTLCIFASDLDKKPVPQSTVKMSIQKLQYSLVEQGKQPYCIIRKDFLFSGRELELETTLDKSFYFHDENIAVNISIRNFSKKTIKQIVIAVVQNVDVSMFTAGHYSTNLTSIDIQEGCPIEPGSILNKTVMLQILPEEYKHQRGVAVEGDIGKENLRLASSTLHVDDHNSKERTNADSFGIHIGYSVKVKALLGAFSGDLICELPFLLIARNCQATPTKQME